MRQSYKALTFGLILIVSILLLLPQPGFAKKKKKKNGLKITAETTLFVDAKGKQCLQLANGKVFAGKASKNGKTFKKYSPAIKTLRKLKRKKKQLARQVKKTKGKAKAKKRTQLQNIKDRLQNLSKKSRNNACKDALGGGGDGEEDTKNLDFSAYSGAFGIREAQILYSRFAFGADWPTLVATKNRGLDSAISDLLTWKNDSQVEAEFADMKCDRYLRSHYTDLEDPEDDPNVDCNPRNPLNFRDDGFEMAMYWSFAHSKNPFHMNFISFIHSQRSAAQMDTLPSTRRHFAPLHWEFLKQFAKTLDYGWFVRNQKDDALVGYHNLNLGENFSYRGIEPPNEDYAREMLELTTMSPENLMGEDNYGVADVISFARALSGRGYDERDIEVGDQDGDGDMDSITIENPALVPNAFIPGPKPVFIGTPFQTTIYDAEDAVDAVLSHPMTYNHMAEELIQEYVHPAPSNASIREIAAIIQTSGLRAAIRTLMRSKALYAEKNQKMLPKSPFEYLFGMIRATNYPIRQGSMRSILTNIGMRMMVPGNRPAGRIFGWNNLTLAGETFVIERRNRMNTELDYGRSVHQARGYSLYDDFLVHMGDDYGPSEALARYVNRLFGLRWSETQIDKVIEYLDYDWQTCDSNEPEEFGCTAGEKFAKREAFDANPDAGDARHHRKVEGLLVLITHLDEFLLK